MSKTKSSLFNKEYIREHYRWKSRTEIAQQLGISQSRVTQIVNEIRCFEQPKEPMPESCIIRPAAIYSNTPSPYGIADEFFGRKLLPR